jgi:hypothetical protein
VSDTHFLANLTSGCALCGVVGPRHWSVDPAAVTCNLCFIELKKLQAQPAVMVPTKAALGAQPPPQGFFSVIKKAPGSAVWGGHVWLRDYLGDFQTGKVVDEPKADTRYPHKCPRCGGAAYLTGNNLVEHPTGEYKCP